MAIGVTFIILASLILAIWVFIEFKRFRHKIWAIVLILVILLGYFSFSSAVKGKDVDFKSMDGLKKAGGLYLAWLGHAFSNMKVITTNAISMDWAGNESKKNNTG
jgi:hypothetical protein